MYPLHVLKLRSSKNNIYKTMSSSFICLVFAPLLFLAFQTATSARDFPAGTDEKAECEEISACIIFGDSTVDAGMNNNRFTVAKSNFPPYGKDFIDHKATGRFTNGRLVTDILAKQFGLSEYVPAYLDPTLTLDDLKTGVSFASAAAGFDPTTVEITNVISFSEQLKYFKEYRQKLEKGIGKNETKKLIDSALFVISAGTNDFIVNYFGGPVRRLIGTLPDYIKFLIGESKKVMRALMDEGARHIGVVGIPPMGCLPLMITLFSDDAIHHRGCIANMSSAAVEYNKMLQDELKTMQRKLKGDGVVLAYLDVYNPLMEMVSGKHGFEGTNAGCCGTGIAEMSIFCNTLSKLCDDADKYIFWDCMHPTQKAYSIIAKGFTPVIQSMYKK